MFKHLFCDIRVICHLDAAGRFDFNLTLICLFVKIVYN